MILGQKHTSTNCLNKYSIRPVEEEDTYSSSQSSLTCWFSYSQYYLVEHIVKTNLATLYIYIIFKPFILALIFNLINSLV